MARPARITNDQILEAARAVFLEQGYAAPTAEVARRAGVSEGSVFKRFPTKNDLFLAALGTSELPDWLSSLDGRVGQGSPRETCVEVVRQSIDFFRKLLPCAVMMWSSKATSPLDVLRSAPDPPPRRSVAALTRYLAGERRLGRVRTEDPEVAARLLLAAAHQFVFFEMVGMLPDGGRDANAFAQQAVELLWTGLGPEGE